MLWKRLAASFVIFLKTYVEKKRKVDIDTTSIASNSVTQKSPRNICAIKGGKKNTSNPKSGFILTSFEETLDKIL